MKSLQTLSLENLFDQYNWDIGSLISIQTKVDGMILKYKMDNLNYYENMMSEYYNKPDQSEYEQMTLDELRKQKMML